MNAPKVNLHRLIGELDKRWQIESDRRAIRMMYFDLAARSNDVDLLRRIIESESKAAPSCFIPKERKSFWESIGEYALFIWVVGCLLGMLYMAIRAVYSFLSGDNSN